MKMKRLFASVLAGAVAISVMAVPVMAQAKTPHITKQSQYYYSGSDGWVLDGTTKYNYRKDGTTKDYKHTYYNNGKEEGWYKYTYTYKNNRIIKMVGKYSDKTQDSTSKYTYGKNKTTVKMYNYKGKYTGKDVTTYKYSGKVLKSTTSKFYDEKGKVTGKDVWTYDKNGNTITGKFYGSDGKLYSSYKNTYKNGKLIKEVDARYTDGKKTSESKSTYSYKGGYTTVKEYDNEGNLSNERKYKTKPDKAGNTIYAYTKSYYIDYDYETGKEITVSNTTTYKNTMYKSGAGNGCLKESVTTNDSGQKVYKENYTYKKY